jgi:hypothetical protein
LASAEYDARVEGAVDFGTVFRIEDGKIAE